MSGKKHRHPTESDESPAATHEHPRRRRRGDDTTAIDIVLGLGFIAVGAWTIVYQLRTPPINTPVVLTAFAGGVFGALLISPDAVDNGLSKLGRAVRGVLPFGGGSGSGRGNSSQGDA